MSTDERGLSESLQWAVLLPVVMLTVLGIIQSGIWLHGRSVAANAALAGAEAQALSGAGGGTGARVVGCAAHWGAAGGGPPCGAPRGRAHHRAGRAGEA
ncbi:MAG: pilus assembly protein, partial [Luteococcus sp.]|uniref:TadE/TadG family type IV pilus assembly protein n=1 Tax=Luteococcus sp. TaxID=1969402 RepID=UPI00264A2CD8